MTTRMAPKGGYYPDISLPHDEPVELYNNALSNCSQKVRICLAEAGVSYRNRHIHLIETGSYETCAPWYKKINPGATVPTLVHEGHPIYESSNQILYIDKTFGAGDGDNKSSSLTPPGKEEEIARWVEYTSITGDPRKNLEAMTKSMGACIPGISLLLFVTMIAEIPYRNIFWGLWHHPNKERPCFFFLFKLLGPQVFRIPLVAKLVRSSRQNLRQHLQDLEEVLGRDGGRDYLCGSTFTLADVGLMACFARMQLLDYDFHWKGDDNGNSLPRVTAYFARLESRPSYQNAILGDDNNLPIMQRGSDKIKQLKQTRPWFKRMAEGDNK